MSLTDLCLLVSQPSLVLPLEPAHAKHLKNGDLHHPISEALGYRVRIITSFQVLIGVLRALIFFFMFINQIYFSFTVSLEWFKWAFWDIRLHFKFIVVSRQSFIHILHHVTLWNFAIFRALRHVFSFLQRRNLGDVFRLFLLYIHLVAIGYKRFCVIIDCKRGISHICRIQLVHRLGQFTFPLEGSMGLLLFCR